jgi:integrase/recombinase XerD
MLSEFFKSTVRIRAIRSGPFGLALENFASHLLQGGYAEISARRHIRSAEHIIDWASRRRLSLRDLDETALQRFGNHLVRCHCGRYCRADRIDILAGARCSRGVCKA